MGGELDLVKLIIKLQSVRSSHERSFLDCFEVFLQTEYRSAQFGKGGMRQRPQLEVPLEKNKALASSAPKHKGDGREGKRLFFLIFFLLFLCSKSLL